jgi:hypothetical protein
MALDAIGPESAVVNRVGRDDVIMLGWLGHLLDHQAATLW